MAVVFISRGTASGVQALMDGFGTRTRATWIAREDLVRQVSQHGDWATKLVEQLSQAISAYDHFGRIRRPYIVLMRQALLEKIRHDNVIYHGFSGHLLVPRLSHFVRIRISAPLSLRVSMTMARLRCNQEHALAHISQSDEQQVRWARFMYGHDIRNPALYDLNVSLGHLTIKALCGVLEHVLQERDLQPPEELKAQVEHLFLEASVEAALVIDPRTREFEIGARLENGCMLLTGPYLEDTDREAVMEVARKVDGVGRVEFVPGYASQHRLEEYQGDLMLKH